MKNIIKFIIMTAVFCFSVYPAYANTNVEYSDGQSNTEATFGIVLNQLADYQLFSDDCFERYGKSIIKKMANSEGLLYVYSCLEKGIESADTDISVYDGTYPVTVDELKVVLEVYTADYPENFWFSGDCSISYNSQSVTKVYPKYFVDGESADKEKILNAKNVFDSKVASIINDMYEDVTIGATDYETQYKYALWLHDKVADLVEYEYGPNNQNAYGAIVDGKAVCAGYAEAYQHLLNKAGIKAWSIKGESKSEGADKLENHEWNILWLDGNCVYTDVTWDDQGEELFHLYFARSIGEFNYDHFPYTGMYTGAIPTGNHDKCEHSGYFENVLESNVIGEDVSEDKIKRLLKQQSDSLIWDAVIYDPTGTSVLNYWYSPNFNIRKIIPDDFKGSRCEYSINYFGNTVEGAEIHISIRNVDFTRLYLEPDSHLSEVKFRMVVGNDDRDENMNLFVAFYDDEGALMSVESPKLYSYYEHIHMHIPEGCANYKIMLMKNGTFAPLCKSVSLK